MNNPNNYYKINEQRNQGENRILSKLTGHKLGEEERKESIFFTETQVC